MSNETIANVEAQLRKAKETLGFSEALERLQQNRDFKTVIVDGYLNKEAIRLVHAKAEVATQTPAAQSSIVRDIDAIGSLYQFFRKIEIDGAIAQKEIPFHEEEIAALMSDDAED